MSSIESSLLWLATKINPITGLVSSFEYNSDYPDFVLTPAAGVTASYTRLKDQALTLLSLLPKYSIQSTNPYTNLYEYFYRSKIESLVATLLTITENDSNSPELFPEYVNTLSKINLIENVKSVNTTAWIIYALSEYYLLRKSLVVQPASAVPLDRVEQKLHFFIFSGLLTARNSVSGPAENLFAHSKLASNSFSTDKYYLLDSIVSVLALLTASIAFTAGSFTSEEEKTAVYNIIILSFTAIVSCVNTDTNIPYYSIAFDGIFDKSTNSSELLIFYGLLLYSFGKNSKVTSILKLLINFEFPKNQLGFAEFVHKFTTVVVGLKPFTSPNIEMPDPKISYMASLLYKKLNRMEEAEELLNNVSQYLKTDTINLIDYSYSIFTMDPSANITGNSVIQPWKSIESTCWSVLNAQYKEIFSNGYVNSPWALSPVSKFTSLNLIDPVSGNLLDTDLKVFKKLIDTTYLVVAKYIPINDNRFNPILLLHGHDYKFNFNTNNIYINSRAIKEAFGLVYKDDTFLNDIKFEILFLSRTPEEDSIEATYSDLTRDSHISKRNHSKFNRIIYKKANEAKELVRKSIIKESFLEIDSTTAEIKENPTKAKLFRKDLGELLPPTRTTLHRQPLPVQIDSSDEINPLLRFKNLIDYDIFNPLEKENWKIRVLKNSQYQGSEQVTTGIWTNYFGVTVPRNSSVLTIPYSSVDTSAEAQLYSRDSLRWKDFIGNMSFSSIYEFLGCRKNNPARIAIWTRGSANKLPRPYKSSHRATGQDGDSVQGFRRDEVLFNRIENISDYETVTSALDGDSNYLYGTVKGSIVNRSLVNVTSNALDEIPILPNSMLFTHKNNISVKKYINNSFVPVLSTSLFKTLITSYKNIQYPVLSKEHEKQFYIQNPTLVNTFSRYEDESNSEYKGPFNFTDRSEYYIKIVDAGSKKVTTTLKKLPYCGNLNLRACYKSGDLFQDVFDNFTIEAGEGSIRYHDSFVVDSFESALYPFKHSSPIIVWFNDLTGDPINYGFYPVSYSNTATPNVKVRLNGIELEFKTRWTITSDPVPAVFLMLNPENTFTDNKDTLSIEYDACGPVIPDAPAVGLQAYVQHETIPANFYAVSNLLVTPVLGKTNTIKFTFNKLPEVQWFRNTRGDFINSGNNPNYYYDDATPNIIIKYNGIELEYLKDWRLEFDSFVLRVIINDTIGTKINPLDTFVIEYYTYDGLIPQLTLGV